MKTKKIIIGELFLLFFILTIFVITNNIYIVDETIYNSIMELRSDLFDWVFKIITKAGNTVPVMCLTIASLLMIKKRKEQIKLGTVVVSTVLINQIIKHIVQRPRPDHIRLIEEKGFSFPSGHSMIAIALYGFLIYYVYKNVKNKYLKVTFMTLLTLLIIGIGCSRVYLGVHYPSDVIGGFSLAIIILVMVIDLCEKHIRGNKND